MADGQPTGFGEVSVSVSAVLEVSEEEEESPPEQSHHDTAQGDVETLEDDEDDE